MDDASKNEHSIQKLDTTNGPGLTMANAGVQLEVTVSTMWESVHRCIGKWVGSWPMNSTAKPYTDQSFLSLWRRFTNLSTMLENGYRR